MKILDDSLNFTTGDSINYAGTSSPPGKRIPEYGIGRLIDSLRNGKGQVRIMYYGDSQVEGDRVTAWLRTQLRNKLGGTGPGLFLPVMPVPYTQSVYVRASSNWKRYNYLSYKSGEISHNDLGPLMAFCRYLPENEISTESVKAWIRIVPSRLADTSASTYDMMRILYRNTGQLVRISVKAGSGHIITDTLPPGPGLNVFTCPLYNEKNILIDLSGVTSPDIYGISIEGSNGVIIDNIPQRGSAGLEFTMVDSDNLRESYRFLTPDFIILHYGLNIVRNIRSDYSYYEIGLKRQISLLKEVSPGTRLVVVGLTDMAYYDEGAVKSYPNIPDIIEAQKLASGEAGALFWDAHRAMGGESSIINWFGKAPPLAKPDLVHFTDQGADTLAALMYSDLFRDTHRNVPAVPGELKLDSLPLASQETAAAKQPKKGKSFPGALASLIFRYDPDKPFIFSTPSFWLFFLLVLAGFSLVYKKLLLRNIYLFAVSLFFYYKSGGFFLILLLIVTITDFTLGLLIYKAGSRARRKALLVTSILLNIGILGYFKYAGFLVETINNLFGTGFAVRDYLADFSNIALGGHLDISTIILPVGISFFTFQSLSYTFEVYRKKLEPVRNILDFGFYVSFFPQLVAGPIVRASEFIPQIYQEYNVSKREFSHAVFLIVKGLVKKIIISDFIAVNFIDRIFELPGAYSGFENLMGVYGYGLQIYCDFSGYTDIAIGLGLILGFRLPFNFNSPYKAHNISDFWKRWHISLSRWLKDYLYIPLGGNRKGKIRTIVNLMITMLIGGLWHGADLRFIIWGGLHGIGLAFNRLRVYITGHEESRNRFLRVISVFATFQFVSFCWIFFRAGDLQNVMLILNRIFTDFLPTSFGTVFNAFGLTFALITAGYMLHFLPEKTREMYRGIFIRIPMPLQMAFVLLIGFLLYSMRTTEIMPFIYFRF